MHVSTVKSKLASRAKRPGRRDLPEDQTGFFRQAFTTMVDRQLKVSKRLPKALFHYTPSDGFAGIVSTGQLHATHVSFMADASEVSHGRRMLQQAVDQVLADWSRWDRAMFMGQLLYSARADDSSLPGVFATCLSANQDDVGQWERYAGIGGGFCIGFDSQELRLLRKPDSAEPISQGHVDLNPVEYNERKQHENFAALLRLAIELREEYGSEFKDPHDAIDALGHALSVPAMRLVVSCKQPGFSSEKEWRLVYNVNEGRRGFPECEYKATANGMKPYVRLQRFEMGKQTPLPLRSVMTGPRQDQRFGPTATLGYLGRPWDGAPFRYGCVDSRFLEKVQPKARKQFSHLVWVGPSRLRLR